MNAAAHAGQTLLDVLTHAPRATDDQTYDALAARGLSVFDADHAFKFTQIAWGRLLSNGIGATLPPTYYCLDAHGTVIEQRTLTSKSRSA